MAGEVLVGLQFAMPFKLLPCDDNLLSLEFEPSDLDIVRAAIVRHFGAITVERARSFLEVRFGGESFTFQNEWDEPCLITSTASGREILRCLYDELLATEVPRSHE